MNYFMLRSFDHAGYYETRLILMAAGLAVAVWFAARRRDFRYTVVFASGVFFQAVMFISHLWEVAAGKLHYFAVPFALGWLKFRSVQNAGHQVQGSQGSVS